MFFPSPFSEPNLKFKDLIGSAMKRLVGLRFWNGSNQDKQLACASRRLLEFARMQKLRLQIRKFSKQNLGWTTGRCPEARIKGYDTYVVLSFLVSEVQSRDCGPLILILCIFLGVPFVFRVPLNFLVLKESGISAKEHVVLCYSNMSWFTSLGDGELSTCLWAADSFLRLLHHADTFLTPQEQEQKMIIGQLFLQTYVSMASKAVASNKKLFRTRPKLHLYHHIVISNRASRVNPTLGSTWMDEDAIKRFFRVKKRTHRRQATLNCLRRWLLGLPEQMRKCMNQLRNWMAKSENMWVRRGCILNILESFL